MQVLILIVVDLQTAKPPILPTSSIIQKQRAFQIYSIIIVPNLYAICDSLCYIYTCLFRPIHNRLHCKSELVEINIFLSPEFHMYTVMIIQYTVFIALVSSTLCGIQSCRVFQELPSGVSPPYHSIYSTCKLHSVRSGDNLEGITGHLWIKS